MSFVESMMPRCASARRAAALAALFACGALLAACGSDVIKGRPPFIGISGMSLQEDVLVVDFRVSNQNGVPMTIQAYELNVTVEAEDLVNERHEHALVIDANSAEPLLVTRGVDSETRRLLGELEAGDRKSLPFELTGRVRTLEDGYLRFEQKGHFYPVPGKPGHFRSAVTQARQLRRDEDI